MLSFSSTDMYQYAYVRIQCLFVILRKSTYIWRIKLLAHCVLVCSWILPTRCSRVHTLCPSSQSLSRSVSHLRLPCAMRWRDVVQIDWSDGFPIKRLMDDTPSVITPGLELRCPHKKISWHQGGHRGGLKNLGIDDGLYEPLDLRSHRKHVEYERP